MKKDKKQETKIIKEGNHGIVINPNVSYSFHVAADTSWTDDINNFYSSRSWDSDPVAIGGFNVVPYGANNNMPKELRDILEIQHLGEGIMRRQRGLLWGQGPELYKVERKEGIRSRIWMDDPEIERWLKDIKYEEFLRSCIVDYIHTEGVFSKLYLNKGARIGAKPFIANIEYMSAAKCRLEWPDNIATNKVARIITGDFEYSKWFSPYPVFDPADPFRNRISIGYYNMTSFARDFYPVPSYYGSLNWINRSSAIPQILKSLTDNSLNIKWHIKSPTSYWDTQAERLKAQCTEKQTQYTEKMLDDLKDETFKKLAEVLAGVKNVGKFFTSETIMNNYGQMEGWEIVSIDQKVKDFIDSQLAIAKYADSAATAGLGLHPSLSNLIVDGKLASGSEQLYALKLYFATEIDVPESIVCQAINYAIEANWPGKNLKLGFYHDVVKTEENVTPEERVKNKV